MPAGDRWWEDPYWTERQWEQPPADTSPPPTPAWSPRPYAGQRGPSPAPSTPVDHKWDGIAAGYKTELEELAFQWQQIAGWAQTITDDALRGMADQHITTLRDMGQWIWNNFGWQQWIGDKPWLAFGVDQTSWQRTTGDYQDAIQRYTGQRPAFTVGGGDQWSQMIGDAMKTGLSASGFIEKLTQDEGIRKQYGWIRFGLTFDDFQNRKTDMRMHFGQDLSNEQALLQLEYMHQTAGAGRGAAVAAPPGERGGPAAVSEVTVR